MLFRGKTVFPFKQTLEFTVLAFKNVNDRVWKGESRNHLAADSHLLLQITDCACPFPLSPTLLAYRMFSRNRLISVSLHRIIWRETLPCPPCKRQTGYTTFSPVKTIYGIQWSYEVVVLTGEGTNRDDCKRPLHSVNVTM